jgi:hypothetical protein
MFVPLHAGLLEKWEFFIISMMKLQLQDMTAVSSFLPRAQRMNQNIVGKFFLHARKISDRNKLSDIPGKILNMMKVAYK